VLIAIRGELDIVSADALRSALANAASEWRPPIVIVDLLYVTLIDSSGIGALVAGYKAVRAVGGNLVVRNANGLVHNQLRVTGLVDMLGAGPPPAERPRSDDAEPRRY
jgi:anti-anti-sigma factor